MTKFFALTPGTDNFTGIAGDYNAFQLDSTTLQSTDTVTGGATGSFFDVIVLTGPGTIAGSQFAGVTNIEQINLSSGGNNVSLTNGLVAGSSTGVFTITDGGGNDTVNASAVSTRTIVFYAAGGADALTGGGGNDSFVFSTTDLTSADTVQGGAGTDNLYFSTAGTVAASAFTNVSGIEGIGLSSGGNNITLTDSLVAGSNSGTFGVSDGAGNDTVDASGVTNGGTIAFFASTGSDTFRGGNGANGYVFTAADLTSADTVQGGSGIDNLFISTPGTLTASAFTNVTNIEALVLANGTNNVTLTNGLVAGSSIGYFAVTGGSGDTVNASGVTNGTAIAFFATSGNDSFTGGNGSDSFLFAAGQLTAADTVVGGGGNDTLWMTTAGTTTTAALAGVTGIEGVFLQAGGTFNLADGITGAATFAAVGSGAVDTFDASAVTGYKVAFTGNGGADVLKGGTQDDTFLIADSAFATINGNGGIDRITLTAASQSFDLTANASKITNLEVIDLNSSLNSTLTLAGTDIAQINSGGNSLYVVGDVDDTVNAGNGWTQIASGVVNNAVAPGHTFFEYQHSTGSLLFVDTAITSLTASSGNGSANVAEGTTAGATVFDANQTGATTYVLGGADVALFSIDATGHISFNASPNFETPLDQGANNVYDLTVTSSNGTATPNFVENVTLTVTNVAPSTPSDSDSATADTVVEGAVAGTYTGVTASSLDAGGGPAVAWSLTGDTSGGGFTIGADGKIKVADASLINYETATHSYDVTAQASDGAGGTSSHTFTIAVTNTNPSAVTDSDSATADTVVEGAASGTYTGLTAASTDVNGPAVTWSLTVDSSGGGFGIGADGKVVIADASKIDYEGSGGSYSVTVQASDTAGGTASQSFNISVTNANPSDPADGDIATADTVNEGAAAGTYTGVTATATDPGGFPAVSWTLTGDTSGGGFTIGADGKINVANAALINYETATHSYDVTAQASDGAGGTSSHTFTIAVGDVAPSTPVDSDGAADQVVENSPNGTYTGVTASSTDVNGPAVTWSLTGDTSGGGFGIDSNGKITVIDSSKIVYNAGSPTYTVTAQASDGTLNSHQDFVITVSPNAAPVIDAPANAPTASVSVAENQTTVTTVHATDADGPSPVSYSIVSGDDGGQFAINSSSGALTFLSAPDFEHPTDTADTAGNNTYVVTVRASDGIAFDDQTITITVTDVNETPTANPDTASVQEAGGVANGTAGNDITAGFNVITGAGTGSVADTDPEGAALTVNAVNGSLANVGAAIHNAPNYGTLTMGSDGSYTYTVNQANTAVQGLRQSTDMLTDQFTYTVSDGTNTSNTTTLTVTIHGQNDNPVANADSVTVAEKGGIANATGGTDITGFTFNAITGTGTGNVADTDVDSAALGETTRVVAVSDGNHLADPQNVIGNVGAGIADNNNYGMLTFQNTFGGGVGDGSYNFAVDQANTEFLLAGEHLDLVYTYKIQDAAGATSVALLNVRIDGADDLPKANADTGSMSEDAAATVFSVESNDSLDHDHDAANTIALGAVTVSGPAGTTFANTDASAALANTSTAVQVTLGAAFQQLHAGETASVTVPYTLTGSPGQTSTTNLVVTVNGANDTPTAVSDTGSMTEDQSGTAFTVLGNDTFDPDHGAPTASTAGAVTVGAITNLSAPAGESIDASDFSISVNATNQIVVTFVGTDVQHLQQGQSATFDVPYTLHGDQPGDTSDSVLHVTVNGVNDAPTGAANYTFNATNSAIGNTSLVLDNGAVPGFPDPAGPQKVISGNLLAGATDVDGPNALATVAVSNAASTHGHYTINTSGEFSYTPTAGYIGTDTFNYTITDGNTPTAGTVSGSVTINVATPKVWYVNADAATDGDGTSANPFNTLTHFQNSGVGNNVDGAGDTIFLYNAVNHYTGASTLTLENNETLIGQSQGLTVNTTTLEAATGSNSGTVIDGGVVLGSGNTISGVTLGNTGAGGTALTGTGFGTFNVDHTAVNTNNNGMVLSSGAFGAGAAFTSFTSSGATDVSLTSVTGSVDLGTGAMAGLFAVSGGSVSTTYSGNLSQANNAAMVSVTGGHTGTMTFQTGALTATNGTGLQFDNADGTYNFNGTNTLSNTVGGVNANAGINIVNGSNGNFSFSSNSSITGQNSTSATAFNVAGNAQPSAGTITYAGTIGATDATDNHGTSVSIVGRTGGTVTFSGNILDSNDVNGGIGISSNTGGTINFSGAAKTLNTGIGDAVSMSGNAGATVNFTGGGLDIDTTNGSGFLASGGTVSVTGSGNTITTVTGNGGGTALSLSSLAVGAGGVLFDSATTTANATPANGSANGIVLNTLTGGAITVSDGTIAGVTSRGVDINATANDITIGADISTTTTGRSVEVTNTTGSKTIAFSGAIDDNGQGINLTTNTNTMNFTGGVQIDTTGGNTGFNATGGGTVNVTGTTNHINSGTGTGLNVANTTIGASNLNFHDISAGTAGGGPVNGIVLNTTGATGHLTIAGDNGSTNNSTGGTIQHTSGAGILLSSTRDVSLDQMNIHDTGGSGVDGTGVTNFTLTNSTINNSGDGLGGSDATLESNIGFNHSASGNSLGNNIAGTLTITGNTLTNAYFSGVDLEGSAGTITTANISNNTITSTTSQTTSKGSGILVNATGDGSAAMSIDAATINSNIVTGFPSGSGIIISGGNTNAAGPAGHLGLFNDNTKVIEIASNTVHGFSAVNEMASFGIAAILGGGNSGSRSEANFNIHNNGTVATPIANMLGQAIQVGNNGFADMRIHTDNNVLAPHNINASQGIGGGNGVIGAGSAWTPHLIWSINGNTISDTDGNGILAVGRQTSGTMDLEVLNNTVATPTSNTSLARRTVEIEAGNAVSTDDAIHLSISGNTVGAGLNGAGAIGVRKQGSVSGVNDFGIFDTTADDGVAGHILASNPSNAQVQAFIQALNPGAAGVDVLQGPGYIRDATHVSPLLAAAGGIQGSSPGETHLSQAQLDSVIAVAIGQWALAGASASQLAALHATTVSVGDLSGNVVGEQSTGHITIDIDAAGHGWFVDPTPNDNSEFTHAANAAGTDLYTDPSNDAAGHLDLLTTVVHEMGHVLGLDDTTDASTANDLMYINLVDGERRLPDAADVAQASASNAIDAESALPASAQAAAGTPVVVGTAGNDIIDAGHGSSILFGGAGADTFVFGAATPLDAPTPAQVTHVADYHAAEGDSFDFSAITSQFHNSGVNDAMVVRAVEDSSGTFATLQVDHIDPMGLPSAPNWVDVAQIDGAHAGDAVNVLIDNHSVHLAQIHVDLLV